MQPSLPPNPYYIDVSDDEHVAYWTHHFGITELQLRNAVLLAGSFISDVKSYIRKKR